jgi:urea transport system permease protein
VGALLGQSFKLAVTKPWFGAQNVDVTAPAWLRGGWEVTKGLQFPYTRIFIIILTILCLFAIYQFLQKSIWGLRIRAVTQNRNMSACLGIPTKTVDALTFALGSGLAGIAGCGISLLGSVGPNTGQNYIVDTFMVVVVGGVGKIVGSVVAALSIGTISYLLGSGTLALLFTPLKPLADFFTFFATSSMAKVMVFALIIAFLQVRPGGIFPQKGRSVES